MSTLRVSGLRLLCVVVVASIAAGCSTAPSQSSPSAPPPPAAKVTDVTGTWELNVESPMGSRASDAVFTQTGETLGGKMVSARGEVPLKGTINGEAITFGINVNVQGQDLQIDYTGTVTGPDTMSGTVVFGSFGDGKWTGKKK
jgi:D-glucosaminate-6-phosphate ammonia-lyase